MTREDMEGLRTPLLLLGVAVALGLLGGGWLLGHEIKTMRFADRSVDVKGLVERTVKSDEATWSIGFKTAGDDLPATFAHSEANKQAVLKFLASQGVAPGEITTGDISVTDRQTGESAQKGSRYVLEQTVSVVTHDVDKLEHAGQQTAQLVQAGVVLTNNSHIAYTFGGINALKPDMITEATRNARAAADRFAADSGSQVGVIRSASQGQFSITADAPGSANDDDVPMYGSGQSADASIMKKVRVVVTITYYLK